MKRFDSAGFGVVTVFALCGCTNPQANKSDEHRYADLEASLRQIQQQPTQNRHYRKLVYPQREEQETTAR